MWVAQVLLQQSPQVTTFHFFREIYGGTLQHHIPVLNSLIGSRLSLGENLVRGEIDQFGQNSRILSSHVDLIYLKYLLMLLGDLLVAAVELV